MSWPMRQGFVVVLGCFSLIICLVTLRISSDHSHQAIWQPPLKLPTPARSHWVALAVPAASATPLNMLRAAAAAICSAARQLPAAAAGALRGSALLHTSAGLSARWAGFDLTEEQLEFQHVAGGLPHAVSMPSPCMLLLTVPLASLASPAQAPPG